MNLTICYRECFKRIFFQVNCGGWLLQQCYCMYSVKCRHSTTKREPLRVGLTNLGTSFKRIKWFARVHVPRQQKRPSPRGVYASRNYLRFLNWANNLSRRREMYCALFKFWSKFKDISLSLNVLPFWTLRRRRRLFRELKCEEVKWTSGNVANDKVVWRYIRLNSNEIVNTMYIFINGTECRGLQSIPCGLPL